MTKVFKSPAEQAIDLEKKSIDITDELNKATEKVPFKDGEDYEDYEGRIWSEISNHYHNMLSPEAMTEIASKRAKELWNNKKKVAQANPTTRQKWNKYFKHIGDGNPRTVDKYNRMIEEIESELPFKNRAEHDKWLDMGSAWMGEPEWPDMTKMLLYRQEHPMQDIKLDRKALADHLKRTKNDIDWGRRMDDIRATFGLDYPESIADLYIRGNTLYGLQTDEEDEPYEVELYNLIK